MEEHCGDVTKVMLLPPTNGFKTAYVRFADEAGAKKAVQKMNGWRPHINSERCAVPLYILVENSESCY
jgi:hypothetical protein